MPNWCWCTMHVEGKKEELDRFMAGIKPRTDGYGRTYPCILASYIPYPDDIPVRTEECGKWMDENWGTKWGDCETEIEWAENGLIAQFETAWAPPRNGIVKLSLLFPTLDFTLWYDEPNMHFGGEIFIRAGNLEVTEDLEGKEYLREREIPE